MKTLKAVWAFLKKHWKLAVIALAVIAALILRKRLSDLLPGWIAQGILGKVTKGNPFQVVDSGHIVAHDPATGEMRIVDTKALGVDANKVTGAGFSLGGKVTVEVANPPLGG